jgi:hypothetical protein
LLLGPYSVCFPLRSIVYIDLKSAKLSSTFYPSLMSQCLKGYILFDMHGGRCINWAGYIISFWFLAEASNGVGREEDAEREVE